MRVAPTLLLLLLTATGCASAPVAHLSSPLCDAAPAEGYAVAPAGWGGVTLRLPEGFALDQREIGHFGVTRWVRGAAEVAIDLNGLSVPQPPACRLELDGFDASIHEFRAGRRHYVAADFVLHAARLDLVADGLAPGRMTVYAGSPRRSDLAELRAVLATVHFSTELRRAVERARAIEQRQGGGAVTEPY